MMKSFMEVAGRARNLHREKYGCKCATNPNPKRFILSPGAWSAFKEFLERSVTERGVSPFTYIDHPPFSELEFARLYDVFAERDDLLLDEAEGELRSQQIGSTIFIRYAQKTDK